MNSSYPIVFYVSGHGFGHTSRTVEVIHEVLTREPAARVVVKTSAPRRLFDRTLENRIELIEQRCDAGMIQLDSLNVDTAGSVAAARRFQADAPQLIEREIAFLRERRARHVVSDIPPMAFRAAAGAGVPSTGISNFTWDWIYEGYPETDPFDLSREIREMYQQATRVLRLPMAGGFAGLGPLVQDIPFIARRSERDPDDIRQLLGLPGRGSGRPVVLTSFGGYGVAGLNSAALATLKDYVVAISDLTTSHRLAGDASGLVAIPEERLYATGLRYEDLIRAVDVVATKPGYGIISDAIANKTAILYTSRGRFIEYDVLVREMPRYLRAQFIEREDLLSGNWAAALEKLLSQPDAPEKPALNGAEVAAEAVLRSL